MCEHLSPAVWSWCFLIGADFAHTFACVRACVRARVRACLRALWNVFSVECGLHRIECTSVRHPVAIECVLLLL